MTRSAAMSAKLAEFCDCCRRLEIGPMLRDDVWRQLADADENWLCASCMCERARARLGRMPAVADLLPCAFNLWLPWFDIFAAGPALDEWRDAARVNLDGLLGHYRRALERKRVPLSVIDPAVDALRILLGERGRFGKGRGAARSRKARR